LKNKIINIKNRVVNSKLTVDSFWALFGNVIAKGLALISGILVARFLGKDIYGEYGIIRGTLMSLAIFSTLGLGYTATKYVAEYKISRPDYVPLILKYARNITLVVSSIIAVVLFFSANYVSAIILEAPQLKLPLQLVSAWLVFNAVTTTQIGVLSGFGEFKAMAKISAIVGVVTFVLSVLFTYLWSLIGALVALLIIQIINCFLNYRLIAKKIKVYKITKVENDKVFLKEMLNFSIPVSLQEGMYALTGWLTSLLLVRYASYGELGMFSAAMQWNAIILFVPGILRNVILAHLANTNKDKNRHNRILKITLLFNFIMTFIPFIIIFVLSNYISAFYGESYVGLESIINLAVFSVIFTSLSNVYAQAFMSKGRNWLMFFIRLVRDVGIIIVTYILLVGDYSYRGAMSLVLSKLIFSIVFLIVIVVIFNNINNKNEK
jgi:O-antigen/teichoic acid export membrane protein